MRILICALFLLCPVFLACGQGTLFFSTTLSGADEPVPNASPVAGTASFALSGTMLTYSVEVQFSGSGSTELGNGGSSSLDPVYFNIPIQVTVNDSGGPIPGLSLPVYDDPGFMPGAGNGFDFLWSDNTATLDAAQVSELATGQWFVNVTTGNFPDGELRGQIMPVPEPATWTLFLFGALSLVIFKARALRKNDGSNLRCRYDNILN